MKKFSTLIFLTALAACQNTASVQTGGSEAKAPIAVGVQSQKQPEQTVSSTEPKVGETSATIENFVDSELVGLGPTDSIKHLDKQIESYKLGADLTPEDVQSNLDLKKRIIRGTFDIRELCRLSLAKHWDDLSVEQQNEFVGLMTRLLEKKAIFSKEQLHGDNKYYQIKYEKEILDPADQNKATVKSHMLIPKRKIDLDLTYKLVKKETVWKIYDVIVDEASLLDNYKLSFDRIIQKDGYADLLKRMKSKLDQIKS